MWYLFLSLRPLVVGFSIFSPLILLHERIDDTTHHISFGNGAESVGAGGGGGSSFDFASRRHFFF